MCVQMHQKSTKSRCVAGSPPHPLGPPGLLAAPVQHLHSSLLGGDISQRIEVQEFPFSLVIFEHSVKLRIERI